MSLKDGHALASVCHPSVVRPSKIFFSETGGLISTKLGLYLQGLEYYNVYRSWGYKAVFMLNSTETKVYPASNECENANNCCSMKFHAILVFMSKDFIVSRVEHKKSFITSRPEPIIHKGATSFLTSVSKAILRIIFTARGCQCKL